MKLYFGHGFNDGKYPTQINGKNIKEYSLWLGMIWRCYCEEAQKKYPAYIDCYVSDNFKSYSYFYEWCQTQCGFKENNWQIDKDLLAKGNKIYSEDSCVFIPRKLNMLTVRHKSRRGGLPIGVYFHKQNGKFRSKISIDGKKIHIGFFDNEIDAFNSYKEKKESHIKSMAENFKDIVDLRVYNALMCYSVEISD